MDTQPSQPAPASPNLRLFDCSARIGPSTVPPVAPALTAEDLLAEMDLCGVDEALVAGDARELSCALESNRWIAQQCASHARLHAVWNILPDQTGEMDPDTLFAEMKAAGVRALSADPKQNRFQLNGLTFGSLFEMMIRRRVPLFLASDWPMLTELLKEFPKLLVVATNIGIWGSDRLFRPLLDSFENFHVETSAYELDGGIKALVERYGPRRILFGSLYHRRPMGSAATQIRSVDIDDDARRMIASGNLERLLEETGL